MDWSKYKFLVHHVFFVLNFYSLEWFIQREGWYRARTFALGLAVTWTSSGGFLMLMFLGHLRNQSVTLAGTVGRLIDSLAGLTYTIKTIMMLCCKKDIQGISAKKHIFLMYFFNCLLSLVYCEHFTLV